MCELFQNAHTHTHIHNPIPVHIRNLLLDGKITLHINHIAYGLGREKHVTRISGLFYRRQSTRAHFQMEKKGGKKLPQLI